MMCPKCGNEMEIGYLFSSKDGAFSGKVYGYLWWIIHPERNVYAAIGDSGNVIYVDPNENVVAAVSACFRPAVHDRIDFIENILLPTINKSP